MTVASPLASLFAAPPVPPPPVPPLDLPGAFQDLLSDVDNETTPQPAPAQHDDDNLLAAAWALAQPAPVAVLDPKPTTIAAPRVTLRQDTPDSTPTAPVAVPGDAQPDAVPDLPPNPAPEPAVESRRVTKLRPVAEAAQPHPAPIAVSKLDTTAPADIPGPAAPSLPPAAPEPPAPGPEAAPAPVPIAPPDETPEPKPDAPVAAERPTRTQPRAALAFAARLRPTPPPIVDRPKADVPEKPAPKAEAPERRSTPQPAASNESKRPTSDPPRTTRPESAESPVERSSSDRRIDFNAAPRGADGPAADIEEQPAAEPPATAKATPQRPAPLSPPVARDIRLEVAGSDRRVEVRLVERSGEVHLAVRTPDARLAEGLRDELPQLSARLEQAGFHAEEWRVASASGTERRMDVAGAANSSPDTQQHDQPGERGGQNPREQQPAPRQPETPRRNSRKGTEFEWLMQSLR